MTRRFQFSLRALPAVILVTLGCVGSEHPLVDEKSSTIEADLIGQWRFQRDGPDDSFRIQKKPGSETVLEVIHHDQAEHLELLLSKIGDQRYLCVGPPPGQMGYVILRYEFHGHDDVWLYRMDDAAIHDAVTKQELSGKVYRFLGELIEVDITSAPEKIRAYLETHGKESFERRSSISLLRLKEGGGD